MTLKPRNNECDAAFTRKLKLYPEFIRQFTCNHRTKSVFYRIVAGDNEQDGQKTDEK